MQFLVFQTRFIRDRWEAVCHRTPSNYLRVGFLTKKFMGVAISFYLVLNVKHDSTILVISKFMCVETLTANYRITTLMTSALDTLSSFNDI